MPVVIVTLVIIKLFVTVTNNVSLGILGLKMIEIDLVDGPRQRRCVFAVYKRLELGVL